MTRINFGFYFWTIYPFLIMLIVSALKALISNKLLNCSEHKKRIILVVLFSSIVGYFSEYFFSIALNGGYTILAWVPWMKIIGTYELKEYLIGFTVIFAVTFLIESVINFIFLKKYLTWKAILRSTFWADLIIQIIIIIFINIILFSIIQGEDGLHIMD